MGLVSQFSGSWKASYKLLSLYSVPMTRGGSSVIFFSFMVSRSSTTRPPMNTPKYSFSIISGQSFPVFCSSFATQPAKELHNKMINTMNKTFVFIMIAC